MAKIAIISILAPRSETLTSRQRASRGDNTAWASLVTKNTTTATPSVMAMIGAMSERSTLKPRRNRKLEIAKAAEAIVGISVDQKATDRRRK
ncbi:hypothetical protein D9M70_420120 [compost metagenome]